MDDFLGAVTAMALIGSGLFAWVLMIGAAAFSAAPPTPKAPNPSPRRPPSEAYAHWYRTEYQREIKLANRAGKPHPMRDRDLDW